MALQKDEILVCVYTIDKPDDVPSIPSPDARSNKPFGVHDKSCGQTAFFQKIATARVGDKFLSVAMPNEIALSLSVSKKSLLAAELKRNEIKQRGLLGETIFDADVAIVYDFLEEIQKSIIFSYKAVEAFCNASIPESFVYKKKNSKSVVEHYDKEAIELWISTSEKINCIVSEVMGCDKPSAQKFWSDFVSLERVRNAVIHSKSRGGPDLLAELFSEKMHDYIISSVELLHYFIQIDPCNPVFPQGFGESKIKVVSVSDSDEFLAKI